MLHNTNELQIISASFLHWPNFPVSQTINNSGTTLAPLQNLCYGIFEPFKFKSLISDHLSHCPHALYFLFKVSQRFSGTRNPQN